MNTRDIREAVELAKRFVAQADKVLDESNMHTNVLGETYETLTTGRNTGKLRRISLDLTCALADMRKPS